jgi:hypothetical protein
MEQIEFDLCVPVDESKLDPNPILQAVFSSEHKWACYRSSSQLEGMRAVFRNTRVIMLPSQGGGQNER